MGFMLVKILASAYYAKQDIKTPVRMAMIVVIANAVLSAALVGPLAHVGLALATSLAALLNAGLLGYGLLKRKAFQFQPGWPAFLLKLITALLAMAAVIYYFSPDLEVWFAATVMKRIMMLAGVVIASGVSYFAALWLTGLRVHHVLARVAEAE
jgi:putative peptidoglycan lipid II flippase